MKQYLPLAAVISVAFVLSLLLPTPARADEVSAAQRRGAAEYLAAAASGNVQALAFAIHPDELDRLRLSLLVQLRADAARGDSAQRLRLFGPLASLADIERMTSLNFFQAIARRGLSVRSHPYEDLKGLVAIRDGNLVHVLVKGIPAKDRGKVQVVEVVSLLPYGKDWKAALPSDLEAQIEDLMAGRGREGSGSVAGDNATRNGAGPATSAAATAATAGARRATPAAADAASTPSIERNPPEILALLAAAETSLIEGRCEDYYRKHLSPGLRKTLASKTLDTLIASCRNGLANRELLIAALRIVRRLPPRYEYDSSRASYDVSGQGLPYERFTLEKLDGQWYVAE